MIIAVYMDRYSKIVETIYFGNIVATKYWKNLKKPPRIPQTFLLKYNDKETPGEKEIMQKLTKRYVPDYSYKRLDIRDNSNL